MDVVNRVIVRREFVLAMLNVAVERYQKRGGVIALVGTSGYGKTAAIDQFIGQSAVKVARYAPESVNGEWKKLPFILPGVTAVVDAYLFPNVQEVIARHCGIHRGLIIIECLDQEMADKLAGGYLVCTVPVGHWKALTGKTPCSEA